MDDEKLLLERVFSESSDGEDDDSTHEDARSEDPTWERIDQIKGLWLCRQFLSSGKQASLLSAIQNERWFTELSNNQAMRFGDLPAWATELSDSIRESVILDNGFDQVDSDSFEGVGETNVFPSDLLWREPLFDQLIVNKYEPGYMCTC